jgi:hypothetical protein
MKKISDKNVLMEELLLSCIRKENMLRDSFSISKEEECLKLQVGEHLKKLSNSLLKDDKEIHKKD